MDHVATASVASGLDELLELLGQGDIIEIPKGVTLWSPDSPSFPSEVEGVDHAEPIMVHEFALAAGLSVIISQDCDLRRDPAVEPYLAIAPLTKLDDGLYARARPGLSPRFFAYPAFDSPDGERHERLAVDLRMVQSVEKLALLSEHVGRVPCPLSQPRRADLRRWLGHRFGRVPFPDDVQRHVVDKVNDVIKRASRKSPTDRAVQCIVFLGLAWTPGKPQCRLLVLTDEPARVEHKVGEDELRALQNRLVAGLARTGDYDLQSMISDASEVSAAQMLEFHEITLEVG